MKRILALSLTIFLFSFTSASADLLEVTDQGDIIWKVLAYEDSFLAPDKKGEIKVEKIATTDSQKTNTISLEKNSNQVIIEVEEDSEKKSLELSDWSESLVEIAERPDTEKITINLEGDDFVITQKNVKALTKFPIKIDTKEAKISVKTDTGDKYLFVLPWQAVQTAFRSHSINSLSRETILIKEKDSSLIYQIEGERLINLFNLYVHKEPVEVSVSSVSGEIISDNTPVWIKIYNILFG